MPHMARDVRPPSNPPENPARGLAVWLASGLGAGYSPVAAGTVGALWGLPLTWCVKQLSSPWLEGLATLALLLVGIPLCTAAARRLGRGKDPGVVVYDEIASLPVTFYLVPLDGAAVVLAGFLLNRVSDILKPPPARLLERLPEGLGIMADDCLTAVYAHLALRLLLSAGALQWI